MTTPTSALTTHIPAVLRLITKDGIELKIDGYKYCAGVSITMRADVKSWDEISALVRQTLVSMNLGESAVSVDSDGRD